MQSPLEASRAGRCRWRQSPRAHTRRQHCRARSGTGFRRAASVARMSGTAPRHDVVVIGAGTSGLTVARELGYEPADDAEVYAEALVEVHGEPDLADPVHRRVGGEYTTADFDAENFPA